ncbi:ABC transporter permease subunit [Haladaptatus halobius]|uniref:ABC transporter permease subunit n=1 Tax=Haladaptatus halobius TaxID=2884875 RepID=UPI001D0A0B08|nr:ABC transporter permease subunit [Haladaptatus halobius]
MGFWVQIPVPAFSDGRAKTPIVNSLIHRRPLPLFVRDRLLVQVTRRRVPRGGRLFFAETLTILFVTVLVVEMVFGLPGFGTLAFQAIKARDAGLILATTMLPIFVGLAGNLVQDIAYAVIDPRVEYE